MRKLSLHFRIQLHGLFGVNPKAKKQFLIARRFRWAFWPESYIGMTALQRDAIFVQGSRR
jgi:hypothetical protein